MISFFPSRLSSVRANFAAPLSVWVCSIWSYFYSIFFAKRMTIFAVSKRSSVAVMSTFFKGILHIICMSSNKKVRRIYAKRVIAFMANKERAVEIESLEEVSRYSMGVAFFLFIRHYWIPPVIMSYPYPAISISFPRNARCR
jgi:hypothetical protein